MNEVGVLSTNNFGKYASIKEAIKHSVESPICRGKFNEGKYYQKIPALSSMIFTSNSAPSRDGAHNRRFISIHFTEEEKKEKEEQEEFRKYFDDRNTKNSPLSILGDFTACYIRNNPFILFNKDWNNIAIEILEKFYRLVDVDAPNWIYLLEEQRDAIEESSDNAMFDLRAFLINKINDGYSKHIRSDHMAVTQTNEIVDKLDYCIANKLIPFLSKGMNNDTLIITQDIMSELNASRRIEGLAGLRDVGLHLGFVYVNKDFNGKKRRFLEGSKDDFIKFIDVAVD